jgi:thioredoxin-like negative regulator of GroEL
MSRIIDLAEIGATPQDGVVVQFTHPRCSDCQTLAKKLSAEGTPLALVDVSVRPDLARKYAVTLVPLAFRVAGDGRILSRVAL